MQRQRVEGGGSGARPPLPPHRIGPRRRGRRLAERGRGIGRRARRSAAGRAGGGCAPRGAAGGTRQERGAPGRSAADTRGRRAGERSSAVGGAEGAESSVGLARGCGVIWKEGLGVRLGWWCGLRLGGGDVSVRARCRLRGAARPPAVRVGPGAERSGGRGAAPGARRFGGNRQPRPAFARFGLIFNTCPFIYNSGCSDSSPVSAPIYACTPFSFPFPKGQPKHSPREGESYSAGLGFVCLNIEMEKIPSLCGLINNKSDRFALSINDTGKLSS
uniref:uncharacterized protein n=1 Tax=Lonchura striata TaxID=40157 RepID=UPI000B4DAE51|nr:uncharacterized protein LOC110475073 [Lonchura striata domestica]